MMTVRSFASILEEWAPKDLAWEKDNVGLQVGDGDSVVEKILLALDVTEEVIQEAETNNVQLIVTHHPLLFRPLKSVTPSDRTGQLVRLLIQKNIALYSAHTNLDFTMNGVNVALAEKIGLQGITFLVPLSPMLKKLIVFVPNDYVDRIAEAMGKAGAGNIGNYDLCSFRTEGKGTFRGNAQTSPFIGQPGTMESVEETRLEMVVPKWKLASVLSAMKSVHPYEEVAYDVYSMDNPSPINGMGTIGTLKEEMEAGKFMELVKQNLGCEYMRYSKGKSEKISSVAVCGGSGSEFLSTAISKRADAYITADVSYHTFHDAEGKIFLIDAGHYETERHILPVIQRHLQKECTGRGEGIEIFLAQRTTSAIHWI